MNLAERKIARKMEACQRRYSVLRKRWLKRSTANLRARVRAESTKLDLEKVRDKMRRCEAEYEALSSFRTTAYPPLGERPPRRKR